VKLWLADYLLSSPLLLLLLSFVPVPAVCFLLPADFEMTKETTMKMSVYCGYRLLSLFFVFAGIKRWQGQSILVCVYAALFLPCSACYFFLYFCAPLYFFLCFPSPCVFVLDSVFFWVDCSGFLGFSLVFWVGSSSLFFSPCVISFSGFLLCFCSRSPFPPSALLCSAFYKAQRACPSNQSWLCRTVIPPRTGLWAENVVTIGSALLPIFQLPC